MTFPSRSRRFLLKSSVIHHFFFIQPNVHSGADINFASHATPCIPVGDERCVLGSSFHSNTYPISLTTIFNQLESGCEHLHNQSTYLDHRTISISKLFWSMAVDSSICVCIRFSRDYKRTFL